MDEVCTGQPALTNKVLFHSLNYLINDFASKWQKMKRFIDKCCNRKWAKVFYNRAYSQLRNSSGIRF